MNSIQKLIAVVSIGLLLVGGVLVQQGFAAKGDVREALVAEKIVTPDDASIPGVPVDSPETAVAQAEIIQKHALESTGGKTWAEMDREDPMRPMYGSAASLRTSLMTSYMAFKLADLVIGLGAVFAGIGASGLLGLGLARRER